MLAYKRTIVRRRVLVTLTTGDVFDGLVWARRGPLVVLRDARVIEPGRPSVPIDGELVIERPRIAYIQVLSAPEVT